MLGMDEAIVQTLESPEVILPSVSDPDSVVEYFRFFPETSRGEKFVRVVVKYARNDALVITAHLARRIPRRGE